MSKPTSVTGSESEFEFIETPKAEPPSFGKEEDCGVRTTKVRMAQLRHSPAPVKGLCLTGLDGAHRLVADFRPVVSCNQECPPPS